MKRRILLARDAHTQGHVYVTFCKKKAIENPDYSFSDEAINGILSANSVEKFVRAAEEFSPLSYEAIGSYELRAGLRLLTVAAFKKQMNERFQPCEEERLAEEFFGLRRGGKGVDGGSLREMLRDRDLLCSGEAKRMIEEGLYLDDDYVSIEPLADWMVLRSLVNAGVAFLSGYGDYVLSRICKEAIYRQGPFFERPDAPTERVYALAFAYSTYWLRENLLDKLGHALVDFAQGSDGAESPLLNAIFEKSGSELKMRGAKEICLVSSPRLEGRACSFLNHGAWENRRLFLRFPFEGNQKELAKAYLDALTKTISTMRSPDSKALIGWEYVDVSPVGGPASPSVRYGSQLAAIIHYLNYHPGYREGVCRQCGAGFFAAGRGKPREFCSNACRCADYQRKKGDSVDG